MTPADDIRARLDRWIARQYPGVEMPQGDTPLGYEKLMHYYEHLEIAMLELRLLDKHPEFLALIRKRKSYLRRLRGGELQKEQFRAMTAF